MAPRVPLVGAGVKRGVGSQHCGPRGWLVLPCSINTTQSQWNEKVIRQRVAHKITAHKAAWVLAVGKGGTQLLSDQAAARREVEG